MHLSMSQTSVSHTSMQKWPEIKEKNNNKQIKRIQIKRKYLYFMQLFSADPTIVLDFLKIFVLTTKSWKKNTLKSCSEFPKSIFFPLTAQTEEFMFQNVAYWPTVYKTGLNIIHNIKWGQHKGHHKGHSTEWCSKKQRVMKSRNLFNFHTP